MAKPDFGPMEVPSTAELGEVRQRFVRWVATTTFAPQDMVDDLAVVVSELGANAVQACPKGRPPPTIQAGLGADALHVETCNHIDGTQPAVRDWDPHDPLRSQGRGLLLVAALTDFLSVESRDSQIIIRCSVRLPGHRESEDTVD